MDDRSRPGRTAGVLIPLDADEALRALTQFRRSEAGSDGDPRRGPAEQPREA